jgi:hypothetical protein
MPADRLPAVEWHYSGRLLGPRFFINDYYSRRFSRPAGLFSFGLLDGPQWDRGIKKRPAHEDTALTISRASIPVTRLIRRVVDLASAHKRGAHYSSPCALLEATTAPVSAALRPNPG